MLSAVSAGSVCEGWWRHWWISQLNVCYNDRLFELFSFLFIVCVRGILVSPARGVFLEAPISSAQFVKSNINLRFDASTHRYSKSSLGLKHGGKKNRRNGRQITRILKYLGLGFKIFWQHRPMPTSVMNPKWAGIDARTWSST